jgi:tetratricopeptide (TPR) repeat protein
MFKRTIAALLCATLLAGIVAAQEEGQDGSAAAKLKEAYALRRTSFKKPREVKNRILLETAGIYEQIIKEHSECRAECAQASFRAGEIYRSLKMAERAEASFLRTLQFEKKGDFAARSLNEVGHIHRRKEEYDRAIEFYRRVLSECTDIRDECAEALTWIGKVQLKRNELEKGRQTLLGFADRFPDFPAAAIRNMDLVALSLIDEGKIAEAEDIVESCHQRYGSLSEADPATAKKVEKALKKMKAGERLESQQAKGVKDETSGSVIDED